MSLSPSQGDQSWINCNRIFFWGWQMRGLTLSYGPNRLLYLLQRAGCFGLLVRILILGLPILTTVAAALAVLIAFLLLDIRYPREAVWSSENFEPEGDLYNFGRARQVCCWQPNTASEELEGEMDESAGAQSVGKIPTTKSAPDIRRSKSSFSSSGSLKCLRRNEQGFLTRSTSFRRLLMKASCQT